LSALISRYKFAFIFFAASALSSTQICHPQQVVEPWKAPHFSIEPKALYDAASAVPASDGAGVTILEYDESYTFDDAGRYVHVGYVIYKVLTQQAVEDWDSMSVDWEPWHEARPTIRARVIAGDFSVHTLDPKSISEAPTREGDYKTYSDGKTLRAPYPAIAPGVVVEEEYVERETEPLFAPGYVGRVELGRESVPVAHSRVVLEMPQSLPLRTATLLLPDLKSERTEANGRVTLTFDQGPMEGFEPVDPNLPAEVPHYPTIQFSTGTSWQSIAAEYGKIVDNRADPAAVKAIVEKLVAAKPTTAEKEKAILDYIDREVRYTGIEFGEAALMPHSPAETLAEKYGDCKDKATLLVTMLRTAGIPAYVALLNAGSRMDVPAELPGMGMFDHAIVYVPGNPAHGESELWIDATDQYARLGQLPPDDQGRSALIARADTTTLAKTPQSNSKDNVLLEMRELTLSQYGPAAVSEVTRPKGVFEAEYRNMYADKPDKETRKNLSGYVESEYRTEKLTSIERTDASDFSRPFELTLSGEKARRGYTDLDNAVAAIRLDSIFHRLPDQLKVKEESPEKAKKEDKEKPKKPRTADWELAEPFSAEWQYRIVPPSGFIPKPLPQDAQIPIGPALLTEEFTTGKDGVVNVHLTFDSVKRRYTNAEATELRNKVAELIAGPAIMINFEPAGEVLFREGKVREALASYRSLVTLHPKQAVPHLQVANVLLKAGMGEAARAEARVAVRLDPQSAIAEKTLAQILKHDLVGRNLRAGSDLVGAAEAFRTAIKLDPDDHATQADLAILLEYDPVGRRYGRFSKMKEAIAEYQKVGQEKLAELDLRDNLVFALFYGGDYAGAYKLAQTLSPEPKGLLVACEALLHGGQAGLAEANKRSSTEQGMKEVAQTAGRMLMTTRQYPLAADLLQAGASGDNAAQTLGLARMLRGAQHHEDLHFADTPADLVKHYFLLSVDPDLTEARLESLLSRNARLVLKNEDAALIKRTLESGRKLNDQLARQDTSLDVTLDFLLQAMDPKGEGNDATGYREKLQLTNGTTMTLFIVKEDGVYKILEDSVEKPNSIALETLDRIKSGDLAGAKVLLDWIREDQHLAGGDDPLGGPVFPRFWTKGQAPAAARMKLAAAAILATSKATAAQGIALLEGSVKDAASAQEKTNIQLALTQGYFLEDNFVKLQEVASDLLKQVPESKLAFVESVHALQGLGRYDDAIGLADERLKLLSGDEDALRAKMGIEANRDNFVAARGWAQKLLDQGKQDADLLNLIAWYALFTGKVEDADIASATKSAQMAPNNPSDLHTLACLYAESGKTKEARDLLLKAMDELNLEEPDDNYWYAFGRIAEQYGEREIAVADYHKLEKPKAPLAIPTSSYHLAQIRLKSLGEIGSTTEK